MKYCLLFFALFCFNALCAQQDEPLRVRLCADFKVTASHDHPEWGKTNWVLLNQLDEGKKLKTEFKILYSATGIYILFRGEDEKITSPFERDFDNLFNGDVFEVFLHPDKSIASYLEYEISPLNKELILHMSRNEGRLRGKKPERYETGIQTRKAVSTDGKAAHNASIRSWTAEIFIPFTLLAAYNNVPPKRGTTWNANFFRLDYDSGKMRKWAWAPVKTSFHETDKYQAIRFE